MLKNSNNLQMLIKYYQIQKKDNYMMITDKRVSRMVDLQAVEAWEAFSNLSLEEEAENLLALKKENQS